MKICVATSWRNDYQPDVVHGLKELGHEVYDFRNPKDGDTGFHWSSINPHWESWDTQTYVEGLSHPLAVDGFNQDFDAMKWAEGCVLVMPCGRSAHLEAGWFVGQRKPLWILKSEGEPELMYKMANGIYGGLGPLLLEIQAWEQTQAEIQDPAVQPSQPVRWATFCRDEQRTGFVVPSPRLFRIAGVGAGHDDTKHARVQLWPLNMTTCLMAVVALSSLEWR